MTTWKRITSDPDVMGGQPCIRGLRVTVGNVAMLAAAGQNVETILRSYPYLDREDIEEALAYTEASGDPRLDWLKGGSSIRPVKWDIRLQGRSWDGNEYEERLLQGPEKIEMYDGRLFSSEEERLHMLGMLLENVGLEKAVELGDPAIWKVAVEKLGTKFGAPDADA
jgi:uncharacterized protein (DUF433 family)